MIKTEIKSKQNKSRNRSTLKRDSFPIQELIKNQTINTSLA